MSRVLVAPRDARSILTRTGGYLAGFTHTLQPYGGCEFACVYCYVRELPVQRMNRHRLDWSRWLEPKLNAPDLLARDAERGKLAGARIFLSSATDPYTPAERRFRLTRRCLEVMAEHPPAALVVQTRSPLVCRDVDLLSRIPKVLVSVSVTTDDETVRRAFEPNAPSIGRRVSALAELQAFGIETQAAVSPLLPCEPDTLARLLEPVARRVVIDDFFSGDGAGGRRSRRALDELRRLGHDAWAEPGYAASTIEHFRAVFGPERVGVSREGFVAGASDRCEVPRS